MMFLLMMVLLCMYTALTSEVLCKQVAEPYNELSGSVFLRLDSYRRSDLYYIICVRYKWWFAPAN